MRKAIASLTLIACSNGGLSGMGDSVSGGDPASSPGGSPGSTTPPVKDASSANTTSTDGGGGGVIVIKNPAQDSGASNETAQPVSPMNAYVSGTRLKMRVLATADGAKQFKGWRDTERNEDCDFATAADGQVRCLPSGASIIGYSDSGCTQRIVYQNKGCAAPTRAIEIVQGTLCLGTTYAQRIYSVGAAYAGSQYWSKGATCTGPSSTSSLLTSYDLYNAGSEIPASSFAAATESLE